MADQFLASSVIPGSGLEHHEHRKLLTVLIVVLVIGIIAGVGVWTNSAYTTYQANSEAQQQDAINRQNIQELQKVMAPISDKEKTALNAELSKKITPLTDAEKKSSHDALLKAITK